MLDSLSPHSSINPVNSRATAGGLDENQISTTGETNQVSSRSINSDISPEHTSGSKKDSVQISAEAREIAKLAVRDQEVRTHEAAHAAVGGAFAGAPALTYKKGPDGRSYATGGEVSIDVSPVSGDPMATLQKAEIIRAAALAPAQPSAQDMRVASRASSMAAEARADLMSEGSQELGDPAVAGEDDTSDPSATATTQTNGAAGL